MILHVRPVGLLTGIRVERQSGMWRAYRSMVLDTDWPPETPLGGTAPAARMRPVLYLFDFWMFHEHVFLCVKTRKAYTTLRSGASQIRVKMMTKMYNC